MIFRKINKDEQMIVYEMGFSEWGAKRSLNEYIQTNRTGNYYVLTNEKNIVLGSLAIFKFDELSLKIGHPVLGLGSIIIQKEKRGLGFGKMMIENAILLLHQLYRNPVILLYSDIDPRFYQQFGFVLFPKHLQPYHSSLCMFYYYGKEKIKWKKEFLPLYF